MKVLFINDSTSNPNWGDRAASWMLQEMIARSGGRVSQRITESELGSGSFLQPRARSTAAGPAGEHNRWLQLATPPVLWKLETRLRTCLGASRRGLAIPERVEQFDALRREIMQGPDRCPELLAAMAEADLALIHGDGCMVGHGPLPRAVLFLIHLLKKEFAKTVALVNHTAAFDDPALLAMARSVYPLLDDVVYRDEISADRWRGHWSGRYAPDSAFLLEPAARDAWLPVASRDGFFDVWPDTARFDPSRPYLCLGGSSIYQFDARPTAISNEYAKLIDHIQKIHDGQIVLTASDGKDQRIFRPLAEELALPLVGLLTPVQQAVDIVGNATAYIGGRWHTSIFALRGGTPVIPLTAKTFKMQALVQMAGLPAAAFDALALDEAKHGIARALADCLAQGEELRARLRAWARGQAEDSWGNVAILQRS